MNVYIPNKDINLSFSKKASITKLGSSVQSNQTFKNELMVSGINGNISIGQSSNSTESLINLNILANVLGILGIKVCASVL
ncbi:hypothetical protein PPL_06632 [Heterostelium album PN500]|uniref:Uncharacterized protein n=1 Tax=Heterostelium pallidum (strain ATCC 26659 / Pp 5 / PN500) TaxID=670386 RepID=D3BF99_HETP5|nr:hypothetical protein PPL_06632 [Heterostelium album PN500]EFA79813.1 hypothetical protein PPL_06632 [Heterostelium album PN500]|eukprot:XP_020431934.1 hypothetical protein PPL_06632 [Heterostelium album PN500]